MVNLQVGRHTEHSIFSTQAGEIIGSAVADDMIYIVVQTVNKWKIYKISTEDNNLRPEKIFQSKTEIKWTFPVKGDKIKPTFFEENNLKSDFVLDEIYLVGNNLFFALLSGLASYTDYEKS